MNLTVNLEGAVLNVSVNNWHPFCKIKVNKKDNITASLVGQSIEMDLLGILAVKFNFTANLIYGGDDWGYEVNGSWSGAIGQVVDKKSQMAMCDLSHSFRRHQAVDFSEYLYYDEHTFMAQYPSELRDDYWSYLLKPFDFCIWSAILITAVVLFAAITTKGKTREIGNHFLKTVSIFLMQSNKFIQRESELSLQVLFFFSLLSIFTLCQFYLTALYSMLAVPAYKRPIDSFEDILSAANLNSKYQFYVQNNSYVLEVFRLATLTESPFYYAIGRKFNTTPNAVFSHQSDVARLLDASEWNVLFTDRIGVEACSVAHISVPIHLSKETFDSSMVGIAFQKGSPLLEPFNVVIRHLREMGIIERLIRLIVGDSQQRHRFNQHTKKLRKENGKNNDNDDHTVKVFSLADLRSIFTLAGTGTLITLLTFVFECLRFSLS